MLDSTLQTTFTQQIQPYLRNHIFSNCKALATGNRQTGNGFDLYSSFDPKSFVLIQKDLTPKTRSPLI